VLYAREYIGAGGPGATSPQLFRADDGKIYVVKLQNNRLGPKVLANELIGSRLGESLGLCLPPGGIIKLDDALIARNRRLRRAGVPPGRHFACLYLSGTEFLCRCNIARAVNIKEMAGILLFDHLTHNLDRTLNRRNLLLRREADGWRAYAIDNSHLFRRARWTEESLKRLAPRVKAARQGIFGTLLRKYLSPCDFWPYRARLEKWTDGFLADLVGGVPAEWLPHAAERQAVVNFLAARRDLADAVVTCLAASIPDKHRRADADQMK